MSAGSKPGPGWYFDPEEGWVEITDEEKAVARDYIERGFHQVSCKYRCVAITDSKYNILEQADLTRGQFASFREQKVSDAEYQAKRVRESRRPRAKRFVQIMRALSDERAEELMLDLFGGSGMFRPEVDYAREVGLPPAEGS